MRIITIKDEQSEKLRKPVPDFDFSKHEKSEIVNTVREMRKDMKRAEGVGLSGNQVGLDWRLFVAEVRGDFLAIFNPKILKMSEETEELDEGCLSVPGLFIPIPRAVWVSLEGYDWNGKKVKIKASGTLARVFQPLRTRCCCLQ